MYRPSWLTSELVTDDLVSSVWTIFPVLTSHNLHIHQSVNHYPSLYSTKYVQLNIEQLSPHNINYFHINVYLTPPISVQELNMVWSLWSHAAVLTEPGDLSTSLGGASGLFKSYIRITFSTPPVNKRCVSYYQIKRIELWYKKIRKGMAYRRTPA